MKVVAFNGSPKKNGNTYHAISIVSKELEKEGIEIETVHVGDKPIRGCLACGMCAKNKDARCVIDDQVNEWIQKMIDADGIIIASPVYFAGIAGTMKSFLDRAFYVSSSNGGLFRHKVGAAIAVVRRSGGVTTFEQLNNYLVWSEMIVPGSNYWNVIHGTSPGEVLQDSEGVQILQILAKNMAWVLKLIQNGKDKIKEPERIKKVLTHFIR